MLAYEAPVCSDSCHVSGRVLPARGPLLSPGSRLLSKDCSNTLGPRSAPPSANSHLPATSSGCFPYRSGTPLLQTRSPRLLPRLTWSCLLPAPPPLCCATVALPISSRYCNLLCRSSRRSLASRLQSRFVTHSCLIGQFLSAHQSQRAGWIDQSLVYKKY